MARINTQIENYDIDNYYRLIGLKEAELTIKYLLYETQKEEIKYSEIKFDIDYESIYTTKSSKLRNDTYR
jgi:hypothetical protein